MALLILALAIPLEGCASIRNFLGFRDTVVLTGEDEVFSIKAGEPSPIDGYVLSEARLFKLYEQARKNQSEKESLDK